MLRQEDSQPAFAVEVVERREHSLSAFRVELGGRLIEEEQARFEREHGGDGHALAFAPGEGVEAAATEVVDAERREEVIEAAVHLRAGEAMLLHAKGDFILDRFGDGLGFGLLEDHAGDGGDAAGGCTRGIDAGDGGGAGVVPAVELGHEAVEDAKERGLAACGRAGEKGELPIEDFQGDIAQGRRSGAGVGVSDVFEPRYHVRTCAALATGGGPSARAGEARTNTRRAAGQAVARASALPAAENWGQGRPANGL